MVGPRAIPDRIARDATVMAVTVGFSWLIAIQGDNSIPVRNGMEIASPVLAMTGQSGAQRNIRTRSPDRPVIVTRGWSR